MKSFRHCRLPLLTGICGALIAAPTLADPQASGSDSLEQVDELEVILVTAQRREERLQDVPIAISVRSGQELAEAGVTTLRDITAVAPSLRITGAGANVQPVIRGVQSQQSDPGNDANVAIYIDGVYQPNHIANNFELADVERIEVLKGPQGTLFGRNATGGAIRVFTLNPSFTPTGRMSLEYGRFNEIVGKGYLSGPLIDDKLAASISLYHQDSDGFHRDALTGQDDVGGVESTTIRGKLKATPSDSTSFLLTLGYTDRYDGDTTAYAARGGNSIARPLLGPGDVIGDQPHEFASNMPAYIESTVRSASLQADFDLSRGTLSATSAYTDTSVGYTQDADFSSADLLFYVISQEQEDFSQEIIYSTEQIGRFSAVAGAFYYHSDGVLDPTDILGPFAGPTTIHIFARQVTEAYAAFGEVNFDLTDSLTLIGGVRYSDETRRAYGTYRFGPGGVPDMPRLGEHSWSSVTPRVSLRYQFADDDSLYVTWSEGFKSGGYNLSTISQTPFDPEEIQSIEVGLKTSPYRVLSANLAAFYYDYSDQQVQVLVDNFNITANAASSEIYGLDADLTAIVTDHFTLTAGLSWLHAEYDEYKDAVVLEPIGGPDCLCGNTGVVVDASGRGMPQSPDWTVGLTASYAREFGFGDLELTGMLFHSDEFYWDINERVREPSYTTVSARATWGPRNTNLRISLWGRNLTDEKYTKTNFVLETGDGVTYARPRTYGVGVEYSF